MLQFVFSVIVLFVGAGMEELLPKCLGVGFPILLTLAQFAASRRRLASMIMFVVCAGAMEDAISSLPPMTSIGYFLVIASVVRWAGVPRLATVMTYPLYQVWLAVCVSGLGGGVFNRILLSLPIGLVTAFAVGAVTVWISGKAALDEEG